MDATLMYTMAATLVGAVTGYMGGKTARDAQGSALQALTTRVDDQQKTIDTIPGLKEEIRILTELVTQRAKVDELIHVVERIEVKIDAQARQS